MGVSEFKILKCATAGVEAISVRTKRDFARHTHDQYGLGVLHFGAHRSHSGRGQVEAQAGNAITVNPGEVHDGASIGDEARAWRVLYLDPPIVDAAAREVFDKSSGTFEFRHPVIDNPRLSEVFLRLYTAETAPGADAMRREELLLFLIALAGRYRNSGPSPVSQVLLAKNRIDDDPVTAVSLAELASLCGLSKFQLVRAFSRTVGLTPHAYVIQKRTERARRLISSGLPLADVAACVGFTDQSHLTNTFSKKYGVSPGVYARALAGAAMLGDRSRALA